jgi:hypothetical protein
VETIAVRSHVRELYGRACGVAKIDSVPASVPKDCKRII